MKESIQLLLAIDSRLSDAKTEANTLLAGGHHQKALDTYRKASSWFESLRTMAAGIKPTDSNVSRVEEQVDESESEVGQGYEAVALATKRYIQRMVDQTKNLGVLFSTDDPLVRALVTTVDGDTEGTFSLLMSTQGCTSHSDDSDQKSEKVTNNDYSANIGASILLTLMALRSNQALAALRVCELSYLPRNSPMTTPIVASTANQQEPVLPSTSTNNEHIIQAVVSAGLVPALVAAVTEANEAADGCEKIFSFIKSTLEAVGATPNGNEVSTLLSVYNQLLILYMKISSRAAKMLAMLAATEELQLIEYFTRGMNSGKVVGSGDLLSKSCSASAKRRYQFLLKAWSKVHEAVAFSQEHLDHWRKLRRTFVGTNTDVASSESGLVNSLALLKTQDEAKYRSLVCLEQHQGSGGSAFTRTFSPQVMPFMSKVHGIGIRSIAAIEDGDCLLHESPVIAAQGGDFEERFSHAVSQLKGLVVKCRADFKVWWSKVRARFGSGAPILAGDVLPFLSIALGTEASTPSEGPPIPPPQTFYALLALLALHTETENDKLFEAEEGALGEEDTLLCSIWHHNAMRIDEMDFRVGGGELRADGNDENCASGLYLIGSRLNHSIRRINAVCIFDMPSKQLRVRALTKIPAGKEIFISYAPLIESFVNQKRHLRFDVVRELQRKPVYNTEDGSIPEGKPVPDATLLEDENETGEDVLAPHLFGLEIIKCPQCNIEIEGKRTNATMKEIKCNVCKTRIPVADYYASVEQRRQMAVELCNGNSKVGSSSAAADRAKAVRILLGVEDGASMLTKNHFLRAQIRMEALAAAVGAELSEDLSARLVHLSRLTAERITELCPPSWPLTTGLKMHYVYCVGRHRIGTNTSHLSDFVGLVAREAKLDPNRTSVKFEDEAPPEYTADHIREPTDLVNRRLLRFIFLSMQDHVIQHGADGAMSTFMERYRPELESVGINNPEALEKAIKMATFIVCR